MSSQNRDNWLVFEDDAGDAAEYDDFSEQIELSADGASERHAYIRDLGSEFGVPISDWMPSIPDRAHTRD